MKIQFSDLEDDPSGLETLSSISKATKFNKWMFDEIRPYCRGKILEVGSGIGNISQFFLKDGQTITLSDLRTAYCGYLSSNFSEYPNLASIAQIKLGTSDFEKVNAVYKEQFDTIYALNVIEHIENDADAINNCKFMLRKGGTLIVLVPAYDFLFSPLDVSLGHFRRYNSKRLQKLLGQPGLEILKINYFNFMGISAWFIASKLMRKTSVEEGKMGLYNFFVPLFRIIDRILFKKAGLSVIGFAKKC